MSKGEENLSSETEISQKGEQIESKQIKSEQIESKQIEPLIVFFKGEKYDITDFIRKHPGGKDVLLENRGKEIAPIMLENEHTNKAYDILARYKMK